MCNFNIFIFNNFNEYLLFKEIFYLKYQPDINKAIETTARRMFRLASTWVRRRYFWVSRCYRIRDPLVWHGITLAADDNACTSASRSSRIGVTTWTQCTIKMAHIVWSLRIDLRKTLNPGAEHPSDSGFIPDTNESYIEGRFGTFRGREWSPLDWRFFHLPTGKSKIHTRRARAIRACESYLYAKADDCQKCSPEKFRLLRNILWRVKRTVQGWY